MHFHQKFRKLNFMTLLLRVDVVDGLFKGYNVTILAYGQTGSGKTHSMGMAYSVGPVEEMGVIPRAVSFMELYQEQLFDLLSKSNRDQSIVDIREDQQKRIVIPGLTEIEVRNAKDTLDCLVRGYRRRAVGATAMNSQSSRSHAIFTIHIQQRKISDNLKQRKQMKEEKLNITKHLMPVIAILLARFKTNVNCIIHLIRIPQYFDFENTSEMEDLGSIYCLLSYGTYLSWELMDIKYMDLNNMVLNAVVCMKRADVLKLKLKEYIEICKDIVKNVTHDDLQQAALIAICSLAANFNRELADHQNPIIHDLVLKLSSDDITLIKKNAEEYVFTKDWTGRHEEDEIQISKRHEVLERFCKLVEFNIIPVTSAYFVLKYHKENGRHNVQPQQDKLHPDHVPDFEENLCADEEFMCWRCA
ncbi:uncharacterized protein LOC113381819 [Ctenocephalides felis]|uniref:uncharacterized protein LOC113381819 n=1 Tax=Ctenocephalides felis TaxID=7515 RepID=UPI000E6E4F32|nr:uncharacterized protein LOC113381819 [Ctenocephalides felis]